MKVLIQHGTKSSIASHMQQLKQSLIKSLANKATIINIVHNVQHYTLDLKNLAILSKLSTVLPTTISPNFTFHTLTLKSLQSIAIQNAIFNLYHYLTTIPFNYGSNMLIILGNKYIMHTTLNIHFVSDSKSTKLQKEDAKHLSQSLLKLLIVYLTDTSHLFILPILNYQTNLLLILRKLNNISKHTF